MSCTFLLCLFFLKYAHKKWYTSRFSDQAKCPRKTIANSTRCAQWPIIASSFSNPVGLELFKTVFGTETCVLDCVWNRDISIVIMFRTYTYGSQETDIFCSQRLELRRMGFKLCLELKHMCSLENEGKGASNNFRRLLPNARNGCESYNPWPLRVFGSIA